MKFKNKYEDHKIKYVYEQYIDEDYTDYIDINNEDLNKRYVDEYDIDEYDVDECDVDSLLEGIISSCGKSLEQRQAEHDALIDLIISLNKEDEEESI